MRDRMGKWVVIAVSGFIGFVFVFYGVFTKDPTVQANHAGSVNGDIITAQEFSRHLSQKMEPLRQMKLTEEQMMQFGLREAAFDELVTRRILIQTAEKWGLEPSPEQIRDAVVEMPVFQKDGKFARDQYQAILAANGMTPGSFEKSMREDLMVNRLRGYFRAMARATDSEVETDHLMTGTKRELKFVVIPPDAGKRDVVVTEAEILAALAEAPKKAMAESRAKERMALPENKGKTEATLVREFIREQLASAKTEDLRKATDAWVKRAQGAWGNGSGKAADTKLESALKAAGLKIQKSGALTKSQSYIPGLGEGTEILKDAFAEKSPLWPGHGGGVKAYPTPRGTVLVTVEKLETADLAKFDATSRVKAREKLEEEKAGDLFGEFIRKVKAQARIKQNGDLFQRASG